MIYTVTLNPSLDYIVSVDNFQMGRTNRTRTEKLCAGGKGINVSIVLRNLGIESIIWGFAAGFTGDELQKQLVEQGISTDLVKVSKGTTRINWKLTDIEGTEINGQGPMITNVETDIFLKKIQCLRKGDIVFLSGSIPYSLPQDFYGRILKMLKNSGVQIILDATKDALLSALPYEPFLIKPNHHELGELFGKELNTIDEVLPYGKKLQHMGAKNVLVSLAGEGAVLLTENEKVFTAQAPKGMVHNSVGAGDAMLAGFIAGWLDKNDYEKAFLMALAAGSASAFSEEFATGEQIEKLYKQLMLGRKHDTML